MSSAVQGISDTISKPGIINLDFADVRSTMANKGTALMGVGVAKGENRAVAAAKAAVSSPLLELSMQGATGILMNISGANLTLLEAQEAADFIYDAAGTEADVMFGAFNEDNENDEIKITVIATGFQDVQPKAPEEPAATKQPEERAAGRQTTAAQTAEPTTSREPRYSGLDDIVIPDFLRRPKQR